MNTTLKIKNCSDDDYGFVHRLAKQNMQIYVEKYWGKWDQEKFKSSFRKENIKIVEFDTKNIGYYDIEFMNNILYLHDIQIIKSFQGKGIGEYLMKIIEKNAKKNGIKKIRFKVFSKNPAKLFYKKLGYNNKGRDTGLLEMEKNI